jgi:hypothetical protein
MSGRDIHTGIDAALAAYRDGAHAEADALFDDRALDAQRARILDRIAHLGHHAKVLRFPAAPVAPHAPVAINRRWISAAAAAGLIVGLVSGQFVHVLSPRAPRASTVSPASAPAQGQPGIVPAMALVQDDGLLGEIDSAVQLRSAAELRVLDELTPFHEPR